MAKNDPKGKKQVRTLRQTTSDKADKKSKKRSLKTPVKKITGPLGKAKAIGQKEYYLPMPNNKAGKVLNKRRRWIPKYFRDSLVELRQVTWPNRMQTVRLTFAVIAFATIFGIVIAIVDFGLDKLFKEILLK